MKHRGRTAFVVGYLAPAALLYGVFLLYPLAQAFIMAFYKWSGLSDKREFVGLRNFERLATDEPYRIALGNNIWMLVVAFLTLMALGVSIAHLLQHRDRLTNTMRGLFLFPHVMSLVAAALLWYFIYSPTGGLLNGVTSTWGKEPVAWLGQKSTALPAVSITFLWWALGFYVMLFSAGLRTIPEDVSEAAMLDGCTGWAKFWRVTWPLLWPVKRIASIYIVINVINTFGLINLMTQGGNPDRATEVLLTYLYEQGIQASSYGYGTAIAVSTFAFVCLFAAVVLVVLRRDPSDSVSRAGRA